MPAKNDITGDVIRSKGPSRSYEDGWDRIFGKKSESDQTVNDKIDEPNTQEPLQPESA